MAKVLDKNKWFEATGYAPHDGQQVIHDDPHRHRVLCNGRRWGKAADVETPVPTPSGWTTMGALLPGDQVYGAQGQICCVVEVTPWYTPERCWEMTFDDGEKVVVDEDHRWLTYDRPARRALTSASRHTEPQVRTTDEIRATLTYQSHDLPRANHSVQVAKPLAGIEDHFPIDPYLLGRWLGDGSSHHGTIGSLLADAAPLLKRGARESKRIGNYVTWRLPGLQKSLRLAGLLLNKHVPEQYLRAPIKIRRLLLAGLIDSDGSCERGRVRFSNSDEKLFWAVHELVVSLGHKVKVSSRIAKLNGVEKRRSWRLTFYPTTAVAFVERKRAHLQAPRRPTTHEMRLIVGVDEVEARPVRCITVDSPDHLFLIGRGMIPTHNTLLGGKEVEPTAFVTNRLGEPMRGWIVGPEYADCEKEFRVVWDMFKRLDIDKVSTKFLNNVDSGNMHIQTKWGFDLQCRSAKHPETLVGEGLDFVLMVEAGRQKRRTWTEYIRPSLSDKRGWSLHTGVPEGATQTSLLYSLWQRGQAWEQGGPWRSWRMPSWTNRIVFPGGRNDQEILDAEADLTKDEFDRQYGAKFVERVGRVMKDWDDEIHVTDLKFQPEWPLYMGIDYGWTNPFVILWIQVDAFNNVYVIGEQRFTHKDTSTIAEEIKADPKWGRLLLHLSAFYPDPAEPDDTETLKRLWKKPARINTGGTIKSRLELIWQAMKPMPVHAPIENQRPGLLVDRSCHQLIWEMREGYRWPEHQSEIKNDSENPMDKDNHGPEALGRFFKGYMSVIGQSRSTRMGRVKYA